MNSAVQHSHPPLAAWLIALAALSAVVAISGLFAPDQWFEGLRKPTWQPRNEVFAPIWALVYVHLGVALALLLQAPADGARQQALAWFGGQLLLNAAWPVLFFGLRSPLLGFVDIALLWTFALGSALAALRVRPLLAWLQLPHLLWVSFALVLNGVILALNW